MLNIQNYVRAESLQQAYELNQNKRNRIVGGMLWMRMSDGSVNTAIDISGLGLDQIEETEDAFSIGAMVSLRQLELHPGLAAYTQGQAAAAVRDIVGVQFRNLATVGGSIFGRFGFSDVLTFFLSMDTEVELYHGGIVSLEAFNQMPKDRDLLVRLIVKKHAAQHAYESMRIARTDFPVLTCAASVTDGAARVVIGARPGRAMVICDEEQILAGDLSTESAEAFAAYAAAHTPTEGNMRGSSEYRSKLVQVLTRRALCRLVEG